MKDQLAARVAIITIFATIAVALYIAKRARDNDPDIQDMLPIAYWLFVCVMGTLVGMAFSIVINLLRDTFVLAFL